MFHRFAGFSVIELIVVLALIGIVAAFGLAMNIDSIARSSAASERDLFVTLLLRNARAAALSNNDQSDHGIFIDNDNKRYILFIGDTYEADDARNRSVPYTHDTISVESTGGNTIVFEQLSGSVTSGTGTVTIESGVATVHVTIRETGQIDW